MRRNRTVICGKSQMMRFRTVAKVPFLPMPSREIRVARNRATPVERYLSSLSQSQAIQFILHQNTPVERYLSSLSQSQAIQFMLHQKTPVERYLSPLSHTMTAIVAFSTSLLSRRAAETVPPEDIPQKMPSSRASLFAAHAHTEFEV
jgi:hypothetical protein